jgi:mannose-6-phosphate isomerase class I
MPLYENRVNAENRIQVPEACAASLTMGSGVVVKEILEAIGKKSAALGRPVTAAFDGWYGADWPAILGQIKAADSGGTVGAYTAISGCVVGKEALREYKQKYITEDPAFGYVNESGRVEEILDSAKIEALKQSLSAKTKSVVLYGYGAATKLLDGQLDLIFYFDKTRQPILWEMWDKKLVPYGADTPDPDYGWKEYYFCDYHMLDHQKLYLYDKLDYWVEGIDTASLKMLPKESYHTVLETLLQYPIKCIKIYQPGPWGAYRYRDLFEVPGLECNAWNELAGPELGMIVDMGGGKVCEMPIMNLIQFQAKWLGAHIAETFPRLFPLDAWLDDGYFPEQVPIERRAMPIHNHPSTDYVKRNFNEPLGRYETYYICEAYEGACTIMGFKQDADLEEWERLCRGSENITEIPNWERFFKVWDTNVGDLFLIPPGTAHGHGGNQMILEMDTCPAISATEYSFFEYDFARNSWDDNTKTMTAKPMRMHLDHAFSTEKWRRESYVKDKLIPKAKVVKWTKDYKFDRFDSIPEMPFEIERFHFSTKAGNDTEGKFAHIVTLTIGSRAKIQSKSNPEYQTVIDRFQSAVVPACYGAYEIISEDGGFCEAVQLRWKKG